MTLLGIVHSLAYFLTVFTRLQPNRACDDVKGTRARDFVTLVCSQRFVLLQGHSANSALNPVHIGPYMYLRAHGHVSTWIVAVYFHSGGHVSISTWLYIHMQNFFMRCGPMRSFIMRYIPVRIIIDSIAVTHKLPYLPTCINETTPSMPTQPTAQRAIAGQDFKI